MSRDTIANVIARINKLRELAKGNTNEHEAAAAAAAAANLIDRYCLSEMDLEVKGEKGAEEIQEVSDPLFKTGRVMFWVDRLAQVLGNHYGCTGYFAHIVDPMEIAKKNPKARRDSYKAYKLVGRKSDVEVVRYFFDWLQPVIVDLMKRNSYGKGVRYSQNYALGVVKGIENQLKLEHERMKQEAAQSNQVQAMVLLDNRFLLSKTHMENLHTNLRPRQVALRGDEDAKARGICDGERIKLNKGLGTNSGPNKLLR